MSATVPQDGKELGTVYNACPSTVFDVSSGPDLTAQEYRDIMGWILTARPGVLAQNVGMPDPVLYRSAVATTFDKFVEGKQGAGPAGRRPGRVARSGRRSARAQH